MVGTGSGQIKANHGQLSDEFVKMNRSVFQFEFEQVNRAEECVPPYRPVLNLTTPEGWKAELT